MADTIINLVVTAPPTVQVTATTQPVNVNLTATTTPSIYPISLAAGNMGLKGDKGDPDTDMAIVFAIALG